MGWRHSLAYLHALPSHERGRQTAYQREEKTSHGVKYQPGEVGDLFGPEDAPLMPFTGGKAAYQGQGDAPPMYTGPSDGVALSGGQSHAPVSAGPTSAGPSSATESDELPPFAAGPSHGEELPPFEGPSNPAGYAAHKAALLEKGRYQEHKAAIINNPNP
jgi:hypothetical protein